MRFDVAMPLTLFSVTTIAIFLYNRIERKLKFTFEEREFQVRDAILLVAAIGLTVSLIVLIPQMALMTIFLFSYSMLLFVFTYLFSDLQKTGAKVFYLVYMGVSFAVATLSLIAFNMNNTIIYGALGFYCLFGFSFIALLHEQIRLSSKERWYMAVLPPASFICLYLFFSRTYLWFPYLLDMFGVIFAVLIVLYLGSLFTWKTSIIFVVLLTIMDIVLVLFTGSMVSAARHVSGLRLPMSIFMPVIPAILTEWGVLYMSLGLGDFFFAGLIGVQTSKRFGTKTAVFSAISMSLSFFAFEVFMLNWDWTAFPGTLMIICGWIPLLLGKQLASRSHEKPTEV